MVKYITIGAVLLGACGIFLWWLSGIITKESRAAYLQGQAECRAEISQAEAKQQQMLRKEEKNVAEKKAQIWAGSSLDESALQRLFDNNLL